MVSVHMLQLLNYFLADMFNCLWQIPEQDAVVQSISVDLDGTLMAAVNNKVATYCCLTISLSVAVEPKRPKRKLLHVWHVCHIVCLQFMWTTEF